MEYVDDVKKYWFCDLVLKQSNDSDTLIFLREIPDLEVVN